MLLSRCTLSRKLARGPTIPAERIDPINYATLAVAVLQRALSDLDMRLYRASARWWLLHLYGDSLWAECGQVNEEMLRAVITDRCKVPARREGMR